MKDLFWHAPPGESGTIRLLGHRTGQCMNPSYIQNICEDRDTGSGIPLLKTYQPKSLSMAVSHPNDATSSLIDLYITSDIVN